MHITLNPVAVAALSGVVYRGARPLTRRDVLSPTRSIGRSLNLYPSSTRYTATTGSLMLELDNRLRDKQGMFRLSPRARVLIYDRDPAEGGTILWVGDGFEFVDVPGEQKCVLHLRDGIEQMQGLTLKPPVPNVAQVGLRAYLGDTTASFLGYDIFSEVAGDEDVLIYPPEKDENALEFLERVLPFLSASRRYYLASDEGRIRVRPLRARTSSVVLRECIGDYRLDDGRGQVWNIIEFETRDREGKFLGARSRDFDLVPGSQAKFGARKLSLKFDHLTGAQGDAMAEALLFSALFARRRVRMKVPATQAIRLLDVVSIDLRTQGAALVRLVGEWVVNELAFDLYDESYMLELIELLPGDRP